MVTRRRLLHLLQVFCLAGTMYTLLLSATPVFVEKNPVLTLALSLSFSLTPTSIIFIYIWWRDGFASALSAISLKDD